MREATAPEGMAPRSATRFKRIYFFGAGASAAVLPTSPTNLELHELLREELRRGDGPLKELGEFLAMWRGADYQDLPTLEELLSILDTCLAKGEPIGRDWGILELTKCREELVESLYRYIGMSSHDADGCRDNGLYKRLLAGTDPRTTSLISLNYDLLLDKALERIGRTPSYELDFQDLAEAPRDDGIPMRLYKLHGSLNWGYCPSCFTTVHNQTNPLPEMQPCPRCGGRMYALIVPPTPLKVPPSPFLSALWKKAEWELAQAHEIVFIGYSLSDADANIRYLLFRGFFGHPPRVSVVLDREDPGVEGRYRRLFPGGVEVYSRGFEAFIEEQAG